MASRTSTDPIEILIDLGMDLGDFSDQDYLGALMEAIAIIEFQTKGEGDVRSVALRKEVAKIRKERRERKNIDPKQKLENPETIWSNIKYGGPQARKTKISAGAFKRGSATGVNVTPKALPTSAIVPYQKSEAEEKKEEKKKGSPKNLILEISETVTRIADILKDQYDLKKDTATFDRKKAERERRDLQKKNLAKRFEGLKKVAEKIIQPVRGIFDRIMSFLFNILLGKFLMKLVDWFGNPENKSKINSIIRFLTNNWPKLLSAYIVFGTGLGRFSRFIVKILARGAVRLAAATAGLLARLFGGRALGKFSRFLGRRGKLIAGGIEAVTTIFAFKALESALTKGLGPEESASIDNDIPVSGYQGGGLVQPIFKFQGGGPVKFNLLDPRTWMSGKAQQTVGDKTGRYSDDTLSGRLLNRRNATNEAIMKMRGYEEGGEVDGPSGTDKIPAMLTDGEFVMSRGAVQKYGVGQLEAMNAAGGGTNVPKVMNGTVYAAGGGRIGSRDPQNYRGEQFINRFIMGDKSLLNQLALGNLNGVLTSLGIKIDKNTEATNRNTDQRRESNRRLDTLKQFINNRKSELESAAPAIAGFLQESAESAQKLNPLPAMGRALSSFAENPYMGEEAIDKLTQERIASGELGEDGLGLTKTTQKNLDEHDAYIRGLYDPEKDTGFMGGLKKVNQIIQNRGAILDPFAMVGLKNEGTEKFVENITGGRVKNLGAKITGLQMAGKGLLGPLGRMFQIDDRGSLGRYLRPAMEYAQSQGHTSVGTEAPGFGQKKYNELVGDKLANLALGQIHFEVDEQGRAKTSDVFDASNMTPKQYLTKSRESLSLAGDILQGKAEGGPVGLAKALYQSAFMGLSGRLATAQNTGFGNLRPMGLDIDLGGGFETKDAPSESEIKSVLKPGAKGYFSNTTGKFYASYAEALKDPQVAAAAKVEETKKKFSFAPNQQPNLTIPDMPTTGSNGSNVTVIKTSSKDKSPSENTGGSEVPNANPGQGNRAKWNILGMSVPALF